MFEKDKERMLQFRDWRDEDISSIKAPTLLITGDHDVVQTNHVVAMSKLIVNSRLMILPATHGSYMGVAESPVPQSKLPEITVEVIVEFLSKP